ESAPGKTVTQIAECCAQHSATRLAFRVLLAWRPPAASSSLEVVLVGQVYECRSSEHDITRCIIRITTSLVAACIASAYDRFCGQESHSAYFDWIIRPLDLQGP